MAEPEAKKRHKPERSSELEEAIRRFVQLAPEDQFELYEQARDHLGELPDGHDARAVAIRYRYEALEAIGKVARHLGLPDKQAPTVQQFEATSKELGLEFSKSKVIRAWGRWRFASQAFVGGYLAYSAAQATRKREVEWYDKGYEEPIEAVRRWLATKPPKETVKAYAAWAEEQNRGAKPGARKLPIYEAIRQRVGCNWADTVKIARGERTTKEARAEPTKGLSIAANRNRHFANKWELRRDALKRLPDLVALGDITRLLGTTKKRATRRCQASGFPKPVQTTTQGHRFWLREEVEAHLAGRNRASADRARARSLMQSPDVAKRLNIGAGKMKSDLVRKRWHAIPPPSMKHAQVSFWLETEVIAWEDDRDRPVS